MTISVLSTSTHDFLLSLYWKYFNNVFQVVCREAFEEDRHLGRPMYYSKLLHVCILAVSFRFADSTRADMKALLLEGTDRESILHHEARMLAKDELNSPGGLPSVQALLILGDLEIGVGRNHAAWMYIGELGQSLVYLLSCVFLGEMHTRYRPMSSSFCALSHQSESPLTDNTPGMASRLAFSLGLHLEPSSTAHSEREANARYLTLCACLVYDRYVAYSVHLSSPI